MRAIFILAALPLVAVLLSTSNAYAAQFSFNPSTGESYGQVDFTLPAAIIAAVSAAGVLLIINERKKAKGIWFSNSEPLK
jgi:hypothetical protein